MLDFQIYIFYVYMKGNFFVPRKTMRYLVVNGVCKSIIKIENLKIKIIHIIFNVC